MRTIMMFLPFATILSFWIATAQEEAYVPGELYENVGLNRPEGRRRYDIYIPSTITTSPPPALLFSLHAALSNKNDQRAFTRWDKLADDRNFIPVWPQGLNNVWEVGGSVDRDFIKALIEQIDMDIKNIMPIGTGIDRKRIYMTGYSNGASFSQWFGYKEEPYVAAVAAMAGDFNSGLRDDALGDREEGDFKPVPVMLIHGYNDQIACWNNWHCLLWIFRHREANRFGWVHWAQVNNCIGEPATIAQNRGLVFGFGHHINNGHRDYLWVKEYQQCDGGVKVRQILNSRDHSGEFWSGNMMGTQRDYNGWILEFLYQFTLPDTQLTTMNTTDMFNATNTTGISNATNTTETP